MNDQQIRDVIAHAFVYASVPRFAGSAEAEAFVAGTSDVPLADFDIDSLALMEVCIAIELNLGVEIVPGDLAELTTMGGIVALAQQRAAAEAGQ
jgi:acyl carrier protein